MTQRVHPMTAVLVLAIVLVGVMVGYSRMQLAEMAPKAPPVAEPQGPPSEDERLGIAWIPDVPTHGYLVSRILPGPPRSRLGRLGVRQSDVLTALNGKGRRFGLNELRVAMDDFERHGRPFSLTVKRAGEEIVLRPTQAPKGAAPDGANEKAETAGGGCAEGGSCAAGGSGSCAEGEGSCSLEEGKGALQKPTVRKSEPVIGK